MEISVPYVNTADNIADFFTKPLEPRVFRAMRDVIMNVECSGPSPRGGVKRKPSKYAGRGG